MSAAQKHIYLTHTAFYRRLSVLDWLFTLFIVAMALFTQNKIAQHMDGYEIAILWGSVVGLIALGWFFKPLRWFTVACVLLSLWGFSAYAGNLANAKTSFALQYVASSQAAIMWLCALVFLATACYLVGTLIPKKINSGNFNNSNTPLNIGTSLAWAAATMGMTGLLIRWYESYLISPDVGHIPVSNLYEVFVLFIVITTLMYLYYEAKFKTQRVGVFVFVLLSFTVGFLLWYTFAKQAHEILPLVPALQSWWMKIHVPANFIGYGAFAIAAMLGVAEILVLTGIGKRFLPAADILDEIMYKSIAVGFLFFTIATILGALWAADAWGRYWSWDPKETWAFIVWLNYAIWLHLRLVAGWRGLILAYWAVAGLLITAFAFVGVNWFLSGLHSYGSL